MSYLILLHQNHSVKDLVSHIISTYKNNCNIAPIINGCINKMLNESKDFLRLEQINIVHDFTNDDIFFKKVMDCLRKY